MYLANRRSFLQLAACSTMALISRKAWSREAPTPIGAQLFTVRNEVTQDLAGTLASLHKIGFSMVESFPGVYGRPAKELRRMVEDAGLTLPSGHFAYDTLEAQLDYASDLGLRFMVCAMLPKPLWTPDGFKQAAAQFDRIGAAAKERGIALCFHNHNFEFQPLAAPSLPTGLDILLQNTNPAFVHWEEDCYWVAQAGQSALGLLKKYQARVPLLHLKDRTASATTTFATGKQSQFFTEIGAGTIDWHPILDIARRDGKLMFIEQDITTLPPLESLALSFKNLQGLLA